jgi:hypothetical protein
MTTFDTEADTEARRAVLSRSGLFQKMTAEALHAVLARAVGRCRTA